MNVDPNSVAFLQMNWSGLKNYVLTKIGKKLYKTLVKRDLYDSSIPLIQLYRVPAGFQVEQRNGNPRSSACRKRTGVYALLPLPASRRKTPLMMAICFSWLVAS